MTDFSIIDGYKSRGYIVNDTSCEEINNDNLTEEEISERWRKILFFYKDGASRTRIAQEVGYHSLTPLKTFIEKYPIENMPKGLVMHKSVKPKPCAYSKDIKANSSVINIQKENKYTYEGDT